MFRSTPPIVPPSGWWTRNWYIAFLAIISIVPLIQPTVPPLIDLMGHMGRYRVEISDPSSPLLTRYYSFNWALMGNLGVDLLIVPMAKIFGLELGVKLIVMTVPPLTILGLLLVAREVHGRLPATAGLVAPFGYCWPFQWGFINYVFAMALTLNAFAFWLYLARVGRLRLRAGLFVPIGCLIWLAHGFAWGVLGLLAFSAEIVRMRDVEGRGYGESLWRGALHCLPLAPPMLLMVMWRSGAVAGKTTDWFNWIAKYVYLISALRNHWMNFDIVLVALLILFVLFGISSIGWRDYGFRMRRTLGVATLVLVIAFAETTFFVFNWLAFWRDGMEPNRAVDATVKLAHALTIPVIASGGLSNMADIDQLCAVEDDGVEGVICGRAIYSGDLDFEKAQARADELNG